MSIRKRDDSVKSGCGYDGAKGEDFTKDSGGKFSKASTKNPIEAGKRDIWSDVTKNQHAEGREDGGKSGPVCYGIDRPQTDGSKTDSKE